MRRLLQVLGGIVGAIILGAVGSGVWERLLSPALSWLSSATANAIASVSGAYEQSIYQRAARDTTDLYLMKLAMLIFVMVGTTLVIGIGLRALSNARIGSHTHQRLTRFMSVQGFSMGLALVIVAFISLARLEAAAQVKEASLRSLEILRPHTGEAMYTQLRSTYYSIETKQDFVAFKAAALDQATKANKKVPLAALKL